jgi:histidinol-phosphate aminotransferase
MKSIFTKLVPDYIRGINPYEPGKPIEEVERELGITNSLKLASNENPLGPSPMALRAIRKTAGRINYYPEGGSPYLLTAVAKRLKVKESELVFGTGSNEVIELLMRCLVRKGDNIVTSKHSFLVYRLIAQGIGASVREAPAKDYGHDLEAMARLVNKKTKLVFIANPNNPTGTYVTQTELVKFLKKAPKIPVVMDEAYYEYAGAKDYPDTIKLRKKFPNLIVLRTFSKCFGLAGLRVGYGVGDSELVNYLNRLRQPFNVNSMAQVGALAALGDAEFVERSVKTNSDGKRQLYKAFDKAGIEYLKTEANFICVNVGHGREVFQNLQREGVIVRPMDVYGLPAFIRVTIGKRAQNIRFLTALKRVLAT